MGRCHHFDEASESLMTTDFVDATASLLAPDSSESVSQSVTDIFRSIGVHTIDPHISETPLKQTVHVQKYFLNVVQNRKELT